MPRSSASAAPLVDRFFQLSILGLVFSGYLAVLGSRYLDLPTALLTGLGILSRVPFVLGLIRLEPPRHLATGITLAYVAFYPIDYFFLSRDFLGATVHLVCFLAVMKILTSSTPRDFLYLVIVAFLELLAASILSSNFNFSGFLALFLFFSVATFASAEIRRSLTRPGAVARFDARRFQLRLGALSLVVAAGILVFTAGLFFFLPRTARAAFQHLSSQRLHIPGFSNEVTLGEFGEFRQSYVPVMQAQMYNGEPVAALKWRGAALSTFDGRKWSNPKEEADTLVVTESRLTLTDEHQLERKGKRIGYEVRLNSINSDALFFPGIPELLRIYTPLVLRTSSGTFRVPFGSSEGLHYSAVSFIESPKSAPALLDLVLPQGQRQRYLQLPELDRRIAGLAHSVVTLSPTDEERARVLESFLRRTYGYTTDLPAHEIRDPLANFLFERRKGHCEYFASAMAVMLRTLGIPSRIVTGFQGGALNPLTEWQMIRASDAHSWVEAWIPGRGWVTYDPTPPDPNAGSATLLGHLAMYLDAAETFWQDWVLSYSREQQIMLATSVEQGTQNLGLRWLDRLGYILDGWRVEATGIARQHGVPALGVAAFLGVCVLLAPKGRSLWHVHRRVRRLKNGEALASDATLLYNRMLEILRRRGFQKPVWLTPWEFAALLPESEISVIVRHLTAAYNELRFGARSSAAARMAALLQQLEHLH